MQILCNIGSPPASRPRLLLGLLLLLAVTLSGCDVETTPTPAPGATATAWRASATATRPLDSGGAATAETVMAVVVRVVDGDTIIVEIDGRQERVRYIGVDTPESVDPNRPVECFGREASAENTRLVERQVVELEKDVSERDRFDRLLRYVYVTGDDGERVFVNLALIANGFANVVTFPPDVKHVDVFRAAEREAREAGRGLWSACE